MSLGDDELSALIRRQATRHAAPDALRAGIRTQVALAEAGRAPAPAPSRRPHWRSAAAGFALGLLCMAALLPLLLPAVGPWLARPERQAQGLAAGLGQALQAELVSRHVQALAQGPLTQVLSSDRHTVKPWFQGRVDFAPPVFDLATDGFPLIGGRVDQLQGRAVAALAYARHRHVVDVFISPGTTSAPPVRAVHKGFNLMHWTDGAMQYWVVSDLERSELETFVRAWQMRAALQ